MWIWWKKGKGNSCQTISHWDVIWNLTRSARNDWLHVSVPLVNRNDVIESERKWNEESSRCLNILLIFFNGHKREDQGIQDTYLLIYIYQLQQNVILFLLVFITRMIIFWCLRNFWCLWVASSRAFWHLIWWLLIQLQLLWLLHPLWELE